MATRLCTLILLVLWVLPAHADDPPGATEVARALVAAFNAHDPGAMAELVSKEFQLYYVNDEGEAELALTGRGQLATEMQNYFKVRPETQSEIVDAVDGRNFVSFREQIVGGASSLAVYEVRDGLVRRAWYFPAEQ